MCIWIYLIYLYMYIYTFLYLSMQKRMFLCLGAYSICMSPAWIWMRICTCLHTYVPYLCVYIMSVYSAPVYPRVSSKNRMYVCIVCISLHMHVSDVHTVWIYIYTQTLTRIHTTTQTSTSISTHIQKHTHTISRICTVAHIIQLYKAIASNNILRSPKLPSRE